MTCWESSTPRRPSSSVATPTFERSGLSDADVATADQVATVLAEQPALAQRPVLIRGGRAIIGRPKSAVPDFLA